ncbi:methyltransferase-like protein 25B isoform X2 [Haliotis rubra]|uniref:methyltransferase-like protein 25B isoform X2 n=1 Tax=Haliotis rubra TaxID=36100 RepID=UPI001EE55A0A|nr:methyltransferase-like protein 25B isoform X2 [Haliotis rubra]
MTSRDLPKFQDLLQFLYEFDWIHNFVTTRFFVDEVWRHMPEEWHNVLMAMSMGELNGLPFESHQDKPHFPESLTRFLQMSHKLSLPRDQVDILSKKPVDPNLKRGMSPKKLHEVTTMSAVVKETAEKAGCDVIVDVGSGLGYLDQVLHKCYGYSVVGVEGCDGHVERAEKRSAKQDLQYGCICNVAFNLEQTREHLTTFQDRVSEAVRNLKPCVHSQKAVNNPRQVDSKLISEKDRKCQAGALAQDEIPNLDDMYSGKHVCPERCLGSYVFDHNDVSDNKAETVAIVSGMCQDGNESTHTTPNLHNNDIRQGYPETGDVPVEVSSSEERRVCMIGLHCCGDLTPTMLWYFLHMSSMRSLCLVSCCYHKMSFSEESNRFNSFPLSEDCLTAYTDLKLQHPAWSLRPVSFRLAAQETRSRWRAQTEADHDTHVRHVAYRGILELFCMEAKVNQLDRKVIRKADFSSFDAFSQSIVTGLDVGSEVRAEYLRHLQELYARHKPHFCYVEVITCLQVLVQPVLETLLQLDRHAYLMEHGVAAQLVPIFQENISPRNITLIANKQ